MTPKTASEYAEELLQRLGELARVFPEDAADYALVSGIVAEDIPALKTAEEEAHRVVDMLLRDYIEVGVRGIVKPEGMEKWRNTPIPACDDLTPNELLEAGRVVDLARRIHSYRHPSYS